MSMTDAALEAWGSAAQKYTIHEETLKYFCRTKELGVKGYDEQTPEELRGATLRRSELFAGHASFTGSEIEYVVPSDTNEGKASHVHIIEINDKRQVCDGQLQA